MNQESEIKAIELQLAGWQKSDSHGRAPMVHFILQSDEDVEWFERFTAAKGKGKNHITGQIFDAAFSLSDQDDQERPAPELKGGPLAKLAGMFCNDPNFSRWLNEHGRFTHMEGLSVNADGQIFNPVMARADILETCKIQSRKELDHNSAAARIFHEEIRLPYSNWLDKQVRPA